MSPEQIKQKIKGKQSYTLNIPESVTDRIIKNARDCMGSLAAKREEMFVLFEERRMAYENAKREFQETKDLIDSIDEDVRQQHLIVDALESFKSKDDPGKRIQFHSDTTMTATEPKGKRPRLVRWQDEAVTILEDKKRFMPAEEIFDLIVQKQHVKEALKLMKTAKAISTVKGTTVDNLVSHALKVSRGEWNGRFKPSFTVYKELIGLVNWVDEKQNPVEPFNAQFLPKRLQREQSVANG
jgi:hypothetical protein